MNIVISPDAFKGSLTAEEVANTMAAAIRSIDPTIQLHILPIADGGEGTLESLVYETNGKLLQTTVSDPLHRPIEACIGLLGDNQSILIEMAQASGLPLVAKHERNPLLSTSFGTGELIRYGLSLGRRHFLIGIGGSATNDGGLGMLRALGMRFLTADGDEIVSPNKLHLLSTIDDHLFDERIQQCTFTIACDVDNPFIGPNGASVVFGPQKGASEADISVLDQALTHFANIIEQSGRLAIHHRKGAGAAGGLGGAFLAFFPCTLKSGIDVVLDAIQFEKAVTHADLVLTGEGKSDAQTIAGKAPFGVQKYARRQHVPTVLISGLIEQSDLLQPYFFEMHSIVNDTISVEQSTAHAQRYLYEATIHFIQNYLKRSE